MHPVTRAALLVAVSAAAGCVQILGDFEKGQTSGSGGTTGSSVSASSGGAGGATTIASSGSATCMSNETLCGSLCVDLTSDPHNCGECGHDCLGSMCASQLCKATTVVASTTTAVTCDMAVDNTSVYWTGSASGVWAAPKGGGAAHEIITTPGACHIAVDASSVYYVATSPLSGVVIAKAPLVGTATETVLASGQTGAYGLAIDKSSVYWAHATSVSKIAKIGGTIVTIALNQTGAHRVAVDSTAADATKVFWTNQAMSGQVASAPASGAGPVFTYAPAEANPNSVAPTATQLFWLNAASLKSAPLGSTSAMTLATGLQGAIELHIDATHAYWVEQPSGSVYRAALTGGPVLPLALNVGASNVTIDGSYVYWTGASSIERVAK